MRMYFDCGTWSYATKTDSHREEDLVNEFLDFRSEHMPTASLENVRMERIETEQDKAVAALVGGM